jgi:hypothetical protein
MIPLVFEFGEANTGNGPAKIPFLRFEEKNPGRQVYFRKIQVIMAAYYSGRMVPPWCNGNARSRAQRYPGDGEEAEAEGAEATAGKEPRPR